MTFDDFSILFSVMKINDICCDSRREGRREMKGRKESRNLEEKILNFCYKLFWPVFILWCLAVLAKIILIFTQGGV